MEQISSCSKDACYTVCDKSIKLINEVILDDLITHTDLGCSIDLLWIYKHCY